MNWGALTAGLVLAIVLEFLLSLLTHAQRALTGGLVLAIVLGAAWYRYSTAEGTSRRLAELYIWLGAVTVAPLAAVHDAAGLAGFLPVAATHLVLIVVAFRALSAATEPQVFPARIASQFLILGSILVWIGASTYPGMELTQIATHRNDHLFTAATFFVGALMTSAGLSVLRTVLRDSGDQVLSQLGLVAFLFGAICWSIHLAFRATVMVAVAQESAAVPPDWYQPLRLWAGALYAIYMSLAYLTIAAFGAAMMKTGWAGKGWGRMFVVFGLVAAAGFIGREGGFDVPLMVQFMPYAMGILLLRRATAGRPVKAATVA